MTDHGNLFGAIEFYQIMSKKGIKPIIGCETYLLTAGSRHKKDTSGEGFLSHITLLSKNRTGYQNLCRLVSVGHLEGFYYKPRIDKELFEQYNSDLIALSGCLRGEIPQLLQRGNFEGAKQAAQYYSKLLGEGNFYLELTDCGMKEQTVVREGLLRLAKEVGLPLVATNDVHYLRQEGSAAHDALVCIQTGKLLSDTNRMKMDSDQLYLKSAEEMKTLFADAPEAISNSVLIAEKCNLELDFKTYHFPRFQVPDQKDLLTYLTEQTLEGFEKRWKEIEIRFANAETKPSRALYLKRLHSELEMIKKTGFAGYFLIVADFISYAKSQGIPVGPGRGSAAGSLVVYCLGITDIDPVEHHLLFERFINPERVTQPDMDIDFCMRRRDEVLQYVTKKYGNVSQIITFGKMKARAVVRDVGRVMGVPYGDVDRLAKLIPNALGITLELALKTEPQLKELAEKDEKIKKLIEVAKMLEGFPRHASTHAAGVVISDQPLVNFLPLYRGQHDETVTQYDMKAVEKVGLIKFDFLGLKTLTVLDDTIKLIEKNHGKKIDLSTLPLDDPLVYKILGEADTSGVFQLESSGMTDLVAKLKPNRFADLIALVALFRPGPLGSGMVDDFIARKHGRTPIRYELPQLEEILADTYGIILYQEQVMQIASRLANFSLGDADILRRAMGKKNAEEMAKQREKFLSGAKVKKIQSFKAEKIFDLMAKFAEYGFNKCVVGETELVDAVTGEIFTVEDLVKEGPGRKIFSCDEKFKIVPRKIEAVISNGKKKVFLLRTRLGYQIRATANHPFLALDGWKHLEELKIGDRIATPRRLFVNTQEEWPEHEVISLAWLISEGNTCHPNSLYFYNNDISLVKDFAAHIEKFPFTKARCYQRKNGRGEVCANTGVRLQADTARKRGHPSRSGAFIWAQKLGLIGKKAREKSIPQQVFRLSPRQLALFLGRLWSGDGFVYGLDNAAPFYATSSEKLAAQVQHLLLRFGIVSRVAMKNFSYKGGIKKGFAVLITGEGSRQLFLDSIGPYLIGRDQQTTALKKYLKKKGAGKGCRDTIPWEVKCWIREAKGASGKTWVEIETETDLSMREFYGGHHLYKRGFRRNTVEKLGRYFYSDRLAALGTSDIYWDEVETIQPEGIRETYDLTVEKNHNFVADGIIVHNSHSTAYAMVAYQTAYFKAHYPTEYMACLLTTEMGNTDKVLFYMQDCTAHDIQILPPDLNESELPFSVVADKKIRFGLAAVKNVGEGAVEIIVESRQKEGPFYSLFDFCERVDSRKSNRRVVESLIKAGAFDFTKARRSQLMAVLDIAIEYGDRRQKDKLSGQFSLLDQFRTMDNGPSTMDQKLPDVEEWPERARLQFEKEVLGFYLTGHPLAQFEKLLAQYATADCLQVAELPDKREIRIAGVVTSLKEITTKKGERMGFITLEDLKGQVEVVVFPETYQKSHTWLKEERPILLVGNVDEGEETNKIIAKQIFLLEEAPQQLTKTIHFRLSSVEASPKQLQALKSVLGRYRGNCAAYLHLIIPNESETVLKLPDDLKIDPIPELVESVQKLFGHNITWFQG